MAEETIVAADTGADGTAETEITATDTDDVGTLREKLAKAEEAKKQIHARAIRAEKALKEKGDGQSSFTKEQGGLNDDVVDLRLDGYSKEDVAFIMKNGGRKVLEDKTSYVTIAINARREQAKAEAEANKVVDTSGMSEVERKFTVEQLKAMPTAELKKILPHAA